MNSSICSKIQNMTVSEIFERMYIDTVSKCLNRQAFEDLADGYKAIAIVDLDSLKYINDNFSHRKGDDLLKRLSAELMYYFDDKNVFRLSGDEFVVTGSCCTALAESLDNLAKHSPFFSYGVGETLEGADQFHLSFNKRAREKQGLRAIRGEAPPWLDEVFSVDSGSLVQAK